jgi:ligand-binding SRPBCC domain-containing protein
MPLDYIHESRVFVARARADVFRFFTAPENLPRLAPPWLHFTIVAAPATLDAGSVLDYRLRWLGVPLRWRSFVRELDAPVRFVDAQVRGPYARWEHRHLFLEEAGGTWIEDRVTYRLPFGPFGRLAHRAIVARQLRAIWRYREQRIGELLGPGPHLPNSRAG